MSVSGISMYSSTQSRLNVMPAKDAARQLKLAQQTDVGESGIEKQAQPDKQTAPERNHAKRTSDPQDFVFDFKKNDHQLVGVTNDLEDIDVEKAMSDMKKETVLDQYKFFVKPANLGTDKDGTVKLVKRG